jgi:hypothetical protein
LFIGDEATANEWQDSLLDAGGEEAVAIEWVEAIHSALESIDKAASLNLPPMGHKEQE